MTEGREKTEHNGIRFIKGEMVQRIEYTPFGKERYVLNPTLRQTPKYTDQIYDVEDGLYFYQSRYYDAVLGRFIQPDTISSQTQNPQTINAYSYALNNPLRYIDPTGHLADRYDGEYDGGTIADDASYNRETGQFEYHANDPDGAHFDFGDESGTVTSREGREIGELSFEYEDREVQELSERGRMVGGSYYYVEKQNLGSSDLLGEKYFLTVGLIFGVLEGVQLAILGALGGFAEFGVGSFLGAYVGFKTGFAIGFTTGFIAAFHFSTFVKDPASFIYPFYTEQNTPTPDRNNNGVSDIFE